MAGRSRNTRWLILPVLALFLSVSAKQVAIAGDSDRPWGWTTHLAYPLTAEGKLQSVNGQLLHPVAAEAFRNMVQAAWNDGVRIVLLSGYRTQAQQARLFYGIAAKRGIALHERARVSAPPGFSEHHTGYAVDVGGGWGGHSLSPSFDQTRAGRWMMANAYRFCFELSFPRGNAQGVAYEPWHWRFIGSAGALRAFAQARTHFPGSPASEMVLAIHGKTLRMDCRAEAQAAIPQQDTSPPVASGPTPAALARLADASPTAQVPPQH